MNNENDNDRGDNVGEQAREIACSDISNDDSIDLIMNDNNDDDKNDDTDIFTKADNSDEINHQ